MDPDTLRLLATAVSGLVGAAIGSTTAILVQRRSMRLEREKLADVSFGRVNALSVAVFRDFMAACKDVESLAEQREGRQPVLDPDIREATAKMWLRFQETEVFCSPDITTSAKALAEALQIVVWHRPEGAAVSEVLAKPRGELFQVAGPVFREATRQADNKRATSP